MVPGRVLYNKGNSTIDIQLEEEQLYHHEKAHLVPL